MTKPLTLPVLEAFAYLHANNLTIDRLWTVTPEDGPPETHISVKPRLEPKLEKPKGDKQ